MSFLKTIEQAVAFLQRHRRVSLRALRREFDLDPETLAELNDELVNVQHIAVLEWDILVYSAERPPAAHVQETPAPEWEPLAYTSPFHPLAFASGIGSGAAALDVCRAAKAAQYRVAEQPRHFDRRA